VIEYFFFPWRDVLINDKCDLFECMTFEMSENPFGGLRAFQNDFARTRSDSPKGVFRNGSARTRSDADAAHMRKASGIMQMRQTTQMQIDEDACIRN